ncbi:cyclic nucleotide-binding domain-containing protein [Phormidium sp. LEGE 05292]|uniref:cyclic nucleotide-binding domain-containing protein n=1 Tax=[Phormidium] sp. LEGE 05292 TaxID=767427 RepID=UPI00187E8CF7|nr:cyclic nucleotide-binding domain-containing protein [Phormidium sp. LEGE 05292]MBE9224193.1 cyclic nucleotide-binding domain-containing protein [Phormidium sp. LEGE 05292]
MQKVFLILGELSDDDVDWIIQTSKWQNITPNTVLIEEGKPVDAIYILLEGTLTVSISALGGKEIATLTSGEVVGEMSFIDFRPPSATVTSLNNSLVLSIPRRELAKKLQFDISFASRFYRSLAILLSLRMRDLVSQLGYGKAEAEEVKLEQLPPYLLDNISLARTRFDWIIRRLRTNESQLKNP